MFKKRPLRQASKTKVEHLKLPKITRIAFFSTGDTALFEARLLVASIRLTNPDVEIIQLTDSTSPTLNSVDDVIRLRENCNHGIMESRVDAFSLVDTTEPTLFLDTDTLVTRPLNLDLENEGDIALCRRFYDREVPFNWLYADMEFPEHKYKSIDQVFPWIASATALHKSGFWNWCGEILRELTPTYKRWYGDQEAIRRVVEQKKLIPRTLCESEFSALPEKILKNRVPSIVHFKGSERKNLQKPFFEKCFGKPKA